jgi:hypothetical protein
MRESSFFRLGSPHRPSADSIVSIATVTASHACPREAFHLAIAAGACALLIGPSHLDANLTPWRRISRCRDAWPSPSALGVALLIASSLPARGPSFAAGRQPPRPSSRGPAETCSGAVLESRPGSGSRRRVDSGASPQVDSDPIACERALRRGMARSRPPFRRQPIDFIEAFSTPARGRSLRSRAARSLPRAVVGAPEHTLRGARQPARFTVM